MTLTPADLAQLAPLLRGVVQQLDVEGLVSGMASGLRSPDAQAHAMAVNEAARPGWVAGTYRESAIKAVVLEAISGLTAPRDVAALETAILGALATPGLDLRALSWHLPNAQGCAEAVDLLPAGDGPLADRARQLVADAKGAGADPRSCVLTNEAGHACLHLQLA